MSILLAYPLYAVYNTCLTWIKQAILGTEAISYTTSCPKHDVRAAMHKQLHGIKPVGLGASFRNLDR